MNASTQSNERLLLRTTEAADQLAISRGKLYELIGRGEVRVVRIDGSVRVAADELRRYVSTLAAAG